ncbi:MAG: hypothetical protein A3H96_14520 [Acidobacteria bacterium RIFCSPLOWO2_02_FULL_67_36]|nr:MAG: hypothetical protein A3H96_14520 [Acidobacteria bacterium RIFCSPLOWO2_02_FULL_67_36]OFW18442.1 MAG: hypothetical protein A3G21_08030 [Acidobacteria bacterium RIFCSPLOWO2_12_FULL_66_21]
MVDRNEIETLKASWRGALSAAHALAALEDRVVGLDPHADLDAAALEELARLAHANGLAAQALRGFIETMRARRAAGAV